MASDNWESFCPQFSQPGKKSGPFIASVSSRCVFSVPYHWCSEMLVEISASKNVKVCKPPMYRVSRQGRTRYYMQLRSCAGSRGFSIFSGWKERGSKPPAPHPFLFGSWFGHHFLLQHHSIEQKCLHSDILADSIQKIFYFPKNSICYKIDLNSFWWSFDIKMKF